MTKLIEKARTATTEMLMEAAMVSADATTKEGAMMRMAVMVVLEERLSAEEFATFADAI